ncbi:tyrosine-type recombinase/integrase [Vibrio alginolyticus]|nr:tyrosine-type recombinase/integrase [Vibrio alginolyticus]MCR9341289.1 tyrosine-type recombinase/integrase [Vibrio alginolyticus]MCR9344710.1 tyrosine-type recombinase/integrase [Vibrio alginolyticus]MCR9353202.1 tyrosine-type recombinase/integrase [Vibrio alginolyticus]MCR9362887.1 tyrosine-type recombinase/integrase [Vibrio alginolyticus]
MGLQDFKFRDLRHESVSRLVEGGLSTQQVTAISGHKSMQMLRRYTHLRAEDLVEELERRRQKRPSNVNTIEISPVIEAHSHYIS